MTCDLVTELGPALALDVVDGTDRGLLEGHLRHCPACSQELAEMRQALAGLALGLPQQEPSAELGRRILAMATADHQASGGRRWASEAGSLPTSDLRPPTVWPSRIGLSALAAAIAALLWAISLQLQIGPTQQQLAEASAQLESNRTSYASLVRVLASSETQVRDLQPSEAAPGAQGRLWIDRTSGQAMMLARDLPPLLDGQSYQVWLVNAQGRISPGLLRESDPGVYYLALQPPGNIGDYQRLGVTREPAGGSPGPTGPRIIGGEI